MNRRRCDPEPGKPIQRDDPYIFVTWITGILSGEDVCAWRAWFRSNFEAAKRADREVDFTAWTSEHDALVQADVVALIEAGWSVYREKQNAFRIVGKSGAVFGGKPDIVAVRGREGLVIDRKTGKRKRKDIWQLVVYLYWLRHEQVAHQALVGLSDHEICGELRYSDGGLPIVMTPADITPEMIQRMKLEIRRAGGEEPPARSPSVGECGFCDVTRDDCPARIDPKPDKNAPLGDF